MMILDVFAKLKRKYCYHVSKAHFIRKINIKNDEWFFILAYGIGDFYLFLSLVDLFKKYNGVEKLSIGVVKKYQLQLIDIFRSDFYKVIDINEYELKFCKKNVFSPGVPLVLHPDYFLKNSCLSLLGYKNFNLNDVYKLLLNISLKEVNAHPVIHDKFIQSAKRRFEDYNILESQLVLISPHANSFDESIIPFEFWERIIFVLQGRGYKVLVNTTQHKQRFEGIINTTCVDFSLNEAIPFVELCENFIGLRSGFCDLISSSKTKKIILYPSFKWYSGSFINGSSIEKMGLGTSNIFEYELKKDTLYDQVDEILSAL